MQDHLHFGAPPKLRPRTAGASRSSLPHHDGLDHRSTASTSTSSFAPQRLASAVNAMKDSSSLLLRQRLESPRPGSAAPQQTPRAPGAATSNNEKGEFMRPPMRPKSATTASRVSRHRMLLVQDVAPPINNNQSEDATLRSAKEDAVRPGDPSNSARFFGKRPFSASPVSYRSTPFNGSNQSSEVASYSAVGRNIKRPHSAAATSRFQPFRSRDKSTASLTSCLSVVSQPSKAPRTSSATITRSRGQSRGDRLMVSTRENADNTFVYAVPRHFLESGLSYNPYDIIPVTHEALFGSGKINQLQDARWDYYTISRSGYTFHAKNDGFQSTFLSLGNWEAQKDLFTKLRDLSTFSAFRYRKVFVAWRQWVRTSKREAARENLIADFYFSYPVLLKGMQDVRIELAKLSKLQLMWNFDGQTVSLKQFNASNAKFIKSRTKELRQITMRIQKILGEVCRVFLDDTAPLRAGFPGHEFALSVRKSSNFHILEGYVQCEQGLASAHQQFLRHKHFQSTRFTTWEAAEARTALLLSSIAEHGKQSEKSAPRRIQKPEADELEDIRWTMASIKRRKCKQLTKFVMLVDFILLETFGRVVKQSLDLLNTFVLRGANAGTIMRLIDRDDLMLAMHQTVSAVRKNSSQSTGEDSVNNTGSSQLRRQPLTRLQIKTFLHTAWEGKLRASDRTASSDGHENNLPISGISVMTMENHLEALFFQALSKHAGPNAEAFSVGDLLFVAENALTQLLVLPHFAASDMSIYTAGSGNDGPSPNKQQTGGGNKLSLEQQVLSIPCLSRQPLFSLNLGASIVAEKRGRRRYQICFKPELGELVRTLQAIIHGFTEAFRGVQPLLTIPELRSVLEFADDIRALNMSSTTNNPEDSGNNCASDEEHFKCPADRLMERLEEDTHYLSVRNDIEDITRDVLNRAKDLGDCYSEVLELRQQNEGVSFELKARQFRRGEYTLEQMKEDATHFNNQLSALESLQLSVDVKFLHFEMHQLQTELLPSPARCLDAMRDLLPRLAREKCDQFLQYIHLSSSKVEKPVVQDLDAFTIYLLHLREVYDEILDKEVELMFLHEFFILLNKLKFSAPIETVKAFELCEPEFQALKSHVQDAHASQGIDILAYTSLLVEGTVQLGRRLNELHSAAGDQELAAQTGTCQEVRDGAVKLYHEATEMQREAARLTRIQQVFEEASNDIRVPSKRFEDLNSLSAELKLKSELWEAVCEADEHLKVCSTDTIQSVDLDKMGVVASHVDVVVENIRQYGSQVVSSFELDRIEKVQATLHGLAPVIRDLRNPHLAERHWSKLEHKMHCSLTPANVEIVESSETEEFDNSEAAVPSRLALQVQQLLVIDVVAHSATIRHVSEEASAEAAIAGSFSSVVRTWEMQNIPVEAKKDRDGRDVYCVGDCGELTSLIEESQVLLRVMDLSTYALVVQERLPKMLHDLEHTKESLELLQMCQRKWDYTQRLVSIDFARTFPEQAKQLQKHDTALRALTLALFNRSLCLPFGVSTEQRQVLVGILEGFEDAAKTLANHLEIKRQAFPAFFQLSNLELAALLSKCRDVSYINSFLFQCFDNVGQIVFGTHEAFQDILQITSRAYGDAERILMGKNIKARGPVEQWLAAVEKRLAEQLRRSTKHAIEILSGINTSYSVDTIPIQSILLADRVVRCGIIENGLRDITVSGANKFERLAGQLTGYSTRVKNQLLPQHSLGVSPREITLRACLILQELHFRDAFASHVASQVSVSMSSGGLAIDWEHQLKFRMDDTTTVGHECHVDVNTLSLPYGFNYVNPNQDTVVTPNSLRSLFSLFACVRHAQGCVLTGRSESGKRTLSLQVSSMLGRRMFIGTINSYAHATRLLIGALCSGGSFCASLQFTRTVEANAALIKTLVATLTAIEHAVLTKNAIVGLHPSPITFVPGTAMLVILPSTMQLSMPDAEDLNIWTESMSRFSVVQCDRVYIVEALLLSKGFEEPRELAKKLTFMWHQVRSCFDVALETGHDALFSFAALKTIIVDAGSHLVDHGASDHQKILIRQAVLQHFRVRIDDGRLEALKRVLHNVFPQTSKVSGERKNNQPLIPREIHECITEAIRELHYAPRKLLLDAVLALSDALTFSTSAVLVGPPGVGKSTAYQVLAQALDVHHHPRDQPATKETDIENSLDSTTPGSVAVHVVLPMAVTVSQLYGSVSLDGHGRIPSIIGGLINAAQELYVPSRKDANSTKSLFDVHNQLWIIFDDALDMRWLEGLLAVLIYSNGISPPLVGFEDGEFMTIPPNLRIVFEVLHLQDATPRFLHANAILPFKLNDLDDSLAPSRLPGSTDSHSRMTVATAYLHRYIELQLEQATTEKQGSIKNPGWSLADTFNVVKQWLVDSTLLTELTTVLDSSNGIVGLSQLQRATNLTSMLQSLLSTACSLPETTKSPTIFAEEISHSQIRVEMALAYSIMWGFAACTSGQTALQRKVSDTIKREFEHLPPTWSRCSADVNLFSTLLDLQELRFIPVVNAAGQTVIPSRVATTTSNGDISMLFVPTASSLVVHAALKEALRSGRGVLLLGSDRARRTTLARNLLSQQEVILSIIAAGGVPARQTSDEDGGQAPKPVDIKANESSTLASVKRLRLRQITLVTFMAMRLQKDPGEGLLTSRAPSVASIHTVDGNASLASVVDAEGGVPLAISPSIDPSKTAMVRQFDRGDVIPFFFATPHSNSSARSGYAATELANCLERMLQRERTGVFEPPPGKTALLILDDLHLACPNEETAKSNSLHPSVYAYVRSMLEHGTVYKSESCQPTLVENLMLFSSMRLENFPTSSERGEPLCKLTSKLFPVLAPSCSLEELYHIFGQTLQIHWSSSSSTQPGSVTLAAAVRHALPLVVAATTVLWDRLSTLCKFCLQDLSRVYRGLAGVSPALLPDMETLLRLWTHECNRTLREPSVGFASPRQDGEVAEEITQMRSVISMVAQRRASARASRMSLGPEAGLNFAAPSKRQSVQGAQPLLDERASPAALLAVFAARSTASSPTGRSLSVKFSRLSQQHLSFREQQHRAAIVGGLWAYVSSSVYYSAASQVGNVQGGDNEAASGGPERLSRRSTASFMRQMSMEAGINNASNDDAIQKRIGRQGRWIYAEISFEDDSEGMAVASVQPYFRDLRTFSSTLMTPRAGGRSKRSDALPRDVIPAPFSLVQVIARIDRVFARPAARLIALDGSGGAVEALLRFASVSKTHESTQSNGAIFTLSGLPEDENSTTCAHVCVAKRWKRLLLELYERVGVAGQEATLMVQRVDLLPLEIVNQIQALMTTGEVPGTLTLEEQVHLATRVRDERLLALKIKHATEVTQIRLEAETTRDRALAELHQQQRDAPTTPLLEAFTLVEVRYQRELRSKLARVDLRWQQDSDDLRREREVESESVAATVMALTRPLGVTSGKWASGVARMCSKLRVVLLVDKKYEQRVRASTPNIFTSCDIVTVPQLDRDSMRTLEYGHFHAQVEQLLSEHRGGREAEAGVIEFLHQVQRSLWTVVCMATDMHLAVNEGGNAAKNRVPMVRSFAMASFFAKLIVEGYKREEAARSKASWFLDLSNRLDRDLGALRSSDVILNEQVTAIDRQLTTDTAKLAEQKQDAERIRGVMERFKVAADEQVQITNEAQKVAQRELNEPMVCLEEANRALLLVDRRHIVEIKSFVSPPPLVHLVLGAVCVLFQLEPSWESARRLLLGDANVVQTLLQFNKDAVSPATLAKLEAEYLRDERFCREEVERQSVAAASMVGWVRAIYQFVTAKHQVQPTLDKLEKAQGRLNTIMQEFQVSKQRAIEADEAWHKTQTAIDAANSRKEALKGEIASLSARCGSGGLAIEALQEERKRQQDVASANSMRRGFSVTTWNALLSAGALAYACELGISSRRDEVFKAWEAAYYHYGGLTPGCPPNSTCITFTPSIAVVLSGTATSERASETPLTTLFTGDYPDGSDPNTEDAVKLVGDLASLGFSRRRLWDTTLLSLVAATPALPLVMITRYSLDLEELLVACARRLWHWYNLHMVCARAPDFDQVFRLAACQGHQLLVLDVEPLDAEPQEQLESPQSCLRAALLWETTRIGGTEHLLVPSRSCDADSDDEGPDTDDPVTADPIELHPKFRLILTTRLSRAAFGEVLDLIPTFNAQLHASDLDGVILDKIWSSPMKSPEGIDNSVCGDGPKLKMALREHSRLALEYEVLHGQLIKILEAAVVTSQFPLEQTQKLRDRVAAIQEARRVFRDKRLEIQKHLRSVKRQSTPLARVGAAVFNAFNTIVKGSVAPLTLQAYLPMLLDALAPSSAVPTSPAPIPTDTQRPSLKHRMSILARSGTSFALSAASGGQLGLPPEVLAKLLTPMVPLVPHGDWHRFVLQVIIALEEMRPTIQTFDRPVHESEDQDADAAESNSNSPRSINTILLQAKLRTGHKRSADESTVSLVTAEDCRTLAVCTSRPDLQRQVVGMIFTGWKAPRTSVDVGGIDAVIHSALPSLSSRCDRLRVGLMLFPELVHNVCDRILAGYGVPLNFPTPAENEEATQQQGFWLRISRGLPEETAVVVLSRHDFSSFTFARRTFFRGVGTSSTLQIRVLQQLGERVFRATKGNELVRLDAERAVPLSQLYTLPQCVHPRDGELQQGVQQLLLMADNFTHVTEMEKNHLEILETVPLAVVNMKGNAATQEHWEALFQILRRSCTQITSTDFQHRNKTDRSTRENLGKRPSTISSDGAAGAVPQNSSQSKRVLAHRSSQSMLSRQSAVDLVTPTYPRLVVAINDLRALPLHLRANVVCFRDEYEDGTSLTSFTKCLQTAVLRLTLYPCVQMLASLTQTADLWLGITGLVLFHATLAFRSCVLRSTYVEALPSIYHPSGTGMVFYYSDDVFLTAISQWLAALREKYHNSQQQRQAERNRDLSDVFQQQIYQRVILSTYARLATGDQELAFLRRLLSECLQVVGWKQTPLSDLAQTPTSSIRRPSRQITIRDNLRATEGLSSARSPSVPMIKRPSPLSPANSPLPLGFLAFPSEGLRQTDLSLSQWLELVWTYSTSIDQQMDTKLHELLLGLHSREDNSPDAMAPQSTGFVMSPPPNWMQAFGWKSEHHAGSSLGDDAELASTIPLQVAIHVLQQIVAEALPPRIDLKRSDHPHDDENTHLNTLESTMVPTYNLHIDAWSDTLHAILRCLVEFETREVPAANDIHDKFAESDEDDQASEDADSNGDEKDGDDHEDLHLIDIEDDRVRDQMIAILRNELPPGLLPPHPSWSLHDVLLHYQNWHQHLLHHHNSSSRRWWLPGILSCNLSLSHLLDVTQSSSSLNQEEVHFTLRLESSANCPSRANIFAIIEGIVLLGATWNELSQALDRVDGPQLYQRVQLIGYLTTEKESNTATLQRVPLLASHDGTLLLECPLAADSSRLSPLSTPLLVPVGSHYC